MKKPSKRPRPANSILAKRKRNRKKRISRMKDFAQKFIKALREQVGD